MVKLLSGGFDFLDALFVGGGHLSFAVGSHLGELVRILVSHISDFGFTGLSVGGHASIALLGVLG